MEMVEKENGTDLEETENTVEEENEGEVGEERIEKWKMQKE